MLRIIRKYLFFFLLQFHVAAASAQFADLKFRHLDITNGLPSEQVSAVVKDQQGYMWIGTNEGLCRYDGTAIKVFRNAANDSNSLPDNFITSLVISKSNRLFIGASKGVYEYAHGKNAFIRLREPNEITPKEKLRKILLLDSRNDLWIFESGMPLLLYNIDTHKSRTLDFYLNENELKVYSVYEGKAGHYWIGCGDKFFNYDVNSNTYKKYTNGYQTADKPNSFTSFYEAPDGTLWCTSLGSGLVHFDPVSGKTQRYLYDEQLKDNVCDCLKLLPDAGTGSSRLWMASPQALYAFDSVTKKFTAYRQDAYNSFSCRINFTQRNFLGLYHDPAQNVLWYYGPNGIDLCSLGEQYIRSFFSITEQQKIPFTEVRGFVQNKTDPGEYFITCANSSAVFVYNEKDRTLVPKVLPLLQTGINAILQMDRDIFWLAGGNDIYEWRPSDNAVKNISSYFADNRYKGRSSKLSLFRDSYNAVWLGTKGQGLCRYDLTTKRTQWYNENHDDEIRTGLDFVPAVTENNGHIYAVEYVGGLFEFSATGQLLHHFTADKTNNHPLSTPVKSYFDIASGRDNSLWMTTYQGLLQFDISKSTFNLFNEQDNMPYGASNKVVEDQHGIIWADYRSCLVAFDPLVKKVRVFNYLNGYTGAQDGTCLLVNDIGDVRVAYGNRIDAMDIDPFKQPSIELPKILITSLQLGDSTVQPQDASGALTHLQVYHRDNVFTITFSLPLFNNLNGFRYFYKLNGYDKDWMDAGNSNSVKYANLPGGDYTFSVKAINSITGGSTSVTSLDITVHPPYYRTWWFFTFCIAAALLIFYRFYRYRLDQLLKVEKVRTGISSDLHDEVGATLSSISIYSNVARKLVESDMDRAKDYLVKIESSSREMIEKMGDIVWSINPQNDSIDRMMVRMNAYAFEILGAKNVKMNWFQQDDVAQQKLSMEQRRNLYLFFKEAVSNIAKYAAASVVNIDLRRKQNEIILCINDNGIGFSNDGRQSGNGLKNMQLRAETLKGKFTLRSVPQQGTTATLSFPV